MKQLSIDHFTLSENHRPMIVAELSGNHNGKIENALQLITEAKQAGADAVKFQTYSAETMTIPSKQPDFVITSGLWEGYSLYELYEWAHTPYGWHKTLFQHAKAEGIIAFSTPFDETAITLLEELNTPAYKIASFELVDTPLIKMAASTGKPIILSTGMASREEIDRAVEVVKSTGNDQLILLRCVSAYPADHSEYHLKTLSDMSKRYDVLTGLSDHTLGNTVATASVPLGCCFIEKHFTLDRTQKGPDAAFSLQPNELRALCTEVKRAWESLGSISYGLTEGQASSTVFRRSIYVVESIAAGEPFTTTNIRRIRPGYGLPPDKYEEILGCSAAQDIEAGTALQLSMITESD